MAFYALILQGVELVVKNRDLANVNALNSTIYLPRFTKSISLCIANFSQFTGCWTFSLIFVFQGHVK